MTKSSSRGRIKGRIRGGMQGQERRDEEPAKQSKMTGRGLGEERKLQQEEIYRPWKRQPNKRALN